MRNLSLGLAECGSILDTDGDPYETGDLGYTSNEYGHSERMKRLRREAGARLTSLFTGSSSLLQMTIGHRSYLNSAKEL